MKQEGWVKKKYRITFDAMIEDRCFLRKERLILIRENFIKICDTFFILKFV